VTDSSLVVGVVRDMDGTFWVWRDWSRGAE
jgi:hypothetical protein